MIHSVFKLYKYAGQIIWYIWFLIYNGLDLLFRNTYYFYPSFMLLFFFLLVADNQSFHYPQKKYAVILKKEGVF